VAELNPWDWKVESVHRHINYMHGAINGRFHDREEKSSSSHARLVAAARSALESIELVKAEWVSNDILRGQFDGFFYGVEDSIRTALAEVEGA